MLNSQSRLLHNTKARLLHNANAIAKLSFGSILALAVINPVRSQITPNGAGTIVNSQGSQINITGGTQAGANLFHSFRDFNVNSSQIANFLSNPQTQNILARINGGNPSMINGLLQVTGGNSNLFLMNPAGIVFGQGASLNIPASFTATTANQIGFGNNLFNAFGDNNFSALIGNPDSFLFTTTQAGSIVNAGNLAVGSGQNISLIAGNTINTGRLTAPGGEIQVLAVPGTNRVRLSQPGQVLSLEIVPPVDGVLRAVDLPALLTGSDLPGIQINPLGQVQVAGTSLPNQQGIAVASGRIDVSSATGNGGVVQVMGNRVAALDARINANGAMGGGIVRLGGEYLGGRDTGIAPALRFNSQRTLVDRNSLIRANATVSGEGGRVIVWADQNTGYFGRITGRGATGRGGFVEVSGRENLAFDGRVELPGFNGLGGTLLLDPLNVIIGTVGTDDAQITGDGIIGADEAPGATWFISTAALSSIAAGTAINITATGNIDLQSDVNLAPGTGEVFLNASSIIASIVPVTLNTFGRNVTLTANIIDATNLSINTVQTGTISGAIQATASNGNLRLGSLFTNNTSINGGAITLNAPLGSITTGSMNSSSSIDGNGGGINLTSQGGITAGNINSSGNQGNGGLLNFATQGNIATGSIITRAGDEGNAGSINFNAIQGAITTGDIDSSGNEGNGGFLDFAAQGNIATGSIIASTNEGNAGSINFNSAQGNITTGTVVANSATGSNGTVALTAPNGTVNSLTTPPATPPETPAENLFDNPRATPSPSPTATLNPLSTPRPSPGVFPNSPLTFSPTSTVPQTLLQPLRSILAEFNNNSPTESGSSISEFGNAPNEINFSPQTPRQISESLSGKLALVTNLTNAEVSPRLSSLDQSFQADFQQYLGINSPSNPPRSLEETQVILNQITENIKVKPALIYISFVPQGSANRFNNDGLATPNNHVARDNDILEIILITGMGQPVRVTSSGAMRNQILDLVNNFRSEVTNFRSSRGFLTPAQRLYELLLAPLEEELKKRGIDNLIFLTDAGLRSIPLAAMHDGNGFIVERYSIGLIPSLNLTPLDHLSLKGSQVLAMGATTFTSSGLSPLPAVSLEVNTVSQLWQGLGFLNDRFTLNNLLQQRQTTPFRIVHLATHGLFNPGDRSKSYIQLWDQRLGLDQLEQLNWNNPPVDLLVLSACQTALGDKEAELGFAGLAINAGVRSALASLWQVNDLATFGLMTKFYQQLQLQPTKSEALRQAQLAMIRGEVRFENGNLVTANGVIPLTEELRNLRNSSLTHPYYWSAFTMVGNPW